jgi:hypothetical protein
MKADSSLRRNAGRAAISSGLETLPGGFGAGPGKLDVGGDAQQAQSARPVGAKDGFADHVDGALSGDLGGEQRA